ncbi:MAG: iron ABC transporter permease [Sphaerobacteraceae bacterium]|nr:MAG: iron ABC transporter permease [Sphaerobacteraceae bacterium]
MIVPLLYLVIRSTGGDASWFEQIFRERTFNLLQNTVFLTLAVTFSSVAVALPLAWLTTRTDLPWRRFWSIVTPLPLVIPSYVGAFTVIAFLGPRGMLQGWLEPVFGIERLPEIYGFAGAWLTLTLFAFPYVLLSLRAAMNGLDPALEESSRSMGFGAITTFFYVTLPNLRPAIAAGSLLIALYVISDFGAVSLMQYDTFTRGIYNQYRGAFDRSTAATLALVLVALTAIILLAESWMRGRARYYRSSAGVTRPSKRHELGRWKYPAVGYCIAVSTVALIMPLFVIGFWLQRGLRAGEPLVLVWDAAFNSGMVSLLAALAALVMATPIVIFSVRYPTWLSYLCERLSYMGFALPGIVVALAFVFFGANYLTPLYQTLGMLILAYVVLFLPQAVGIMRSALLQINPHIEEAAKSLGSSSSGVWFKITGPLIRSGMVSGGLLVFLTVMKELPATILLHPIGFDTLPMRIWNATLEGFWARAAAPSLLLILVAAIPMILLAINEDRRDRQSR